MVKPSSKLFSKRERERILDLGSVAVYINVAEVVGED
jgi:hypothetical protein